MDNMTDREGEDWVRGLRLLEEHAEESKRFQKSVLERMPLESMFLSAEQIKSLMFSVADMANLARRTVDEHYAKGAAQHPSGLGVAGLYLIYSIDSFHPLNIYRKKDGCPGCSR